MSETLSWAKGVLGIWSICLERHLQLQFIQNSMQLVNTLDALLVADSRCPGAGCNAKGLHFIYRLIWKHCQVVAIKFWSPDIQVLAGRQSGNFSSWIFCAFACTFQFVSIFALECQLMRKSGNSISLQFLLLFKLLFCNYNWNLCTFC